MTPAKLFDYLDGKLNGWERAELEKQLANDPHLQKELAAARRIHSGMSGEKQEVVFQDDAAATERGRKMSLRVGVAFIILVALNVGGGLFFIARHEAANPNHKLLEDQIRKAATAAFTPPSLDLGDVTIPAAPAEIKNVANQVADLAQKAGASATIGLADENHVDVAVQIAQDKEQQLRTALLAALPGAHYPPVVPNKAEQGGNEKRNLIIHVLRDDVTPSH